MEKYRKFRCSTTATIIIKAELWQNYCCVLRRAGRWTTRFKNHNAPRKIGHAGQLTFTFLVNNRLNFATKDG